MNKEKLFRIMFALISIGITLISCKETSNEDDQVRNVKFAVALDMPLNINDASLTGATATLTNVQTRQAFTATNFRKSGTQYVDTTNIPAGVYSVDVKGDISYSLDTTLVKSTVKASESNVSVITPTTGNTVSSKTIALNTYNAQDGFVISEIFFTGTLTPEGKQYSDDQYIKIANNSDSTLYADGLAFVESSFSTVLKYDYTPDIMNQAMTIDALYIIPGSGKEHPIKSGKEIIIAFDAKNHKEINPNSLDLSNADFEFCDLWSNPNYSDDDNPNVPNLINWISDNRLQMLHNRGFKSYAIVKPDVDMKTFLNNYRYTYTYLLNYGEYSFDMDGEGYKLPNAWVIDAVNLSVADSYQWNVTSVSLDAGWTHCGSVDGDKTRYGKSVVRKKIGNRYVDTNNSTSDFDADAKPTLFI